MDEVQFNRHWMASLDKQVESAQKSLEMILKHRSEVGRLLMHPKITYEELTKDCNDIVKNMNLTK